jgi:16S rRNA processing protein RimM
VSAGSTADFNPDNLIALGKITRTQGHRGAVRMHPFFEPVSEFEKLETDELILKLPPPPDAAASPYRIVYIDGFSFHQQFVILEFVEVEDMTAAEQLKGAEVLVREELMWKLNEGEFFVHEIIGFEVRGLDDKVLGTKREFLVPMVKEVVKSIDAAGKRISVDLPPGLDEL